jgi:hypothetical protein
VSDNVIPVAEPLVETITEVTEPYTETVGKVAQPIVDPISLVVNPVVTEVAAPLAQPIQETVKSITPSANDTPSANNDGGSQATDVRHPQATSEAWNGSSGSVAAASPTSSGNSSSDIKTSGLETLRSFVSAWSDGFDVDPYGMLVAAGPLALRLLEPLSANPPVDLTSSSGSSGSSSSSTGGSTSFGGSSGAAMLAIMVALMLAIWREMQQQTLTIPAGIVQDIPTPPG